MRITKTQTPNTKLPIQGRADEITPLLDSVASKEELDLLINDFFWEVDNSRECEKLLRDLLKADIGDDRSSGNHHLLDVHNALFKVTRILKFFRDLGKLIPSLSLEIEITKIKDLHIQIDYEALDKDIFRALGLWTWSDDSSLACLEHITRMANNFQQVINLLEACEAYKNQQNDHGEPL